MKITWTDREHGRQFWQWNEVSLEWDKGAFITWEDLKKT